MPLAHTKSPFPTAPASTPPKAIVLLVEDDRLSQRIVGKIFASAGHEVLVADSVGGGLDILRKNPFVDLLVVDNHLGTEMGWNLVSEIRRRSYLNDLPIVTYTESREREVVLHYAELSVQAFHLKPYRTEVLLAELAQAIASGRRARLLETADAVRTRLDLTVEDYAGLLSSSATQLEEDCQTVRRILLSENDPRLGATFRSICQRLPQLGVNITATLGRQAEIELRRGDYSSCTETLGVLDAVAVFVRQRALELLSMKGSVVETNDTGPVAATLSAPSPVFSWAGPAFVQEILACPIGSLGGNVQRLCLNPLFRAGKMSPIELSWRHHAVAAPWFESIAWLDRVDSITTDPIISRLKAITGFEPVVHEILRRTGALPSIGTLEWSTIVNSIGLPKSAVLAVAGRLARIAGTESKIPMSQLRLHALTVMIISFELGRLFRLTHPHRLAAAALARNIGLWTLAAADPFSTSLTLAYAEHSGDRHLAEHEVLGLTFGEAGAQWLASASSPQLYQDTSADHSANNENLFTLLVIRLAEQLAIAACHQDSTLFTELRKSLKHPSNEVLCSMKSIGVTLPMETSDAVDMMISLAKSGAWIAGEIIYPGANPASAAA